MFTGLCAASLGKQGVVVNLDILFADALQNSLRSAMRQAQNRKMLTHVPIQYTTSNLAQLDMAPEFSGDVAGMTDPDKPVF